ncbi:hypothetical protein [Lampropedia cohaerens]|uniref:hypothetical protein n=1 Tax=Lampropedia cohaerens TaxID=1610491 RepID=UPI000A07D11D|nr:hypothetical protein [Lampropedia cohaerens]
MSAARRCLRWLSRRRAIPVLVWAVSLLIAVNVVGIHIAGGIEGWQRWMAAQSGAFLAWRLLLYAVTAWGWLWMRRRLRAREPERAAGQRLLRAEVAAIVAVIVLEAGLLMQAR